MLFRRLYDVICMVGSNDYDVHRLETAIIIVVVLVISVVVYCYGLF